MRPNLRELCLLETLQDMEQPRRVATLARALEDKSLPNKVSLLLAQQIFVLPRRLMHSIRHENIVKGAIGKFLLTCLLQ